MQNNKVFACIFFFFLCSIALQAQALVSSQAEGSYGKDITVFFSCNDPTLDCYFRFITPNSTYKKADKAIVLSATQREERSYLIQVEARRGNTVVISKNFTYTIDKKPPSVPSSNKNNGLYSSPLDIILLSDLNSTIFYSISGSERLTTDYKRYDGQIHLEKMGTLSENVIISAYAIDSWSNTSDSVVFEYTLSFENVVLALPIKNTIPINEKLELPEVISAKTQNGILSLQFDSKNTKGKLMVYVASEVIPVPDSNFLILRENIDTFEIPIPYGFRGSLYVYYGIRDANGFQSVNSSPIVLIPEDQIVPNIEFDPPEPELKLTSSGTLLVSFPDNSNKIFYQALNKSYAEYKGTVVLESTVEEKITIYFYSVDSNGLKSNVKQVEAILPKKVKSVQLVGVEDNKSYSDRVNIRYDDSAIVRYEITKDGSLPQEVTSQSAPLPASIYFDGEKGKTIIFTIRYRTFSSTNADALMSGEKALRWVIDQELPLVPQVSGKKAQGFFTSDKVLEFIKTEDKIFYRIEIEGNIQNDFTEYNDRIILKAPDSDRITYVIRAYAKDIVGNVSSEIDPIVISLDKSSIYLSEEGNDENDGSLDFPVKTLQYALELCKKNSKAIINVFGTIQLDDELLLSTNVTIRGGFDSNFGYKKNNLGIIRTVKMDIKNMIKIPKGISIIFDNIYLYSNDTSVTSLILCDGTLKANNSEFLLSTKGNGTVVVGKYSKINFTNCKIYLHNGFSINAFKIDNSSLDIISTQIISNSKALYYVPILSESSTLNILKSRIEGSAVHGICAISANNSNISMNGNSLFLEDTSMFIQCFSFSNSIARLTNNIIECKNAYDVMLFDLNSSSLAFYQNTVSFSNLNSVFVTQNSTQDIINNIFSVSKKNDKSMFFYGTTLEASIGPNYIFGIAIMSVDETFNEIIKTRSITEKVFNAWKLGPKGEPLLFKDSKCVDSGAYIKGMELEDFNGSSRFDGKPDLGAIEYQKQ